MLPVYLCITLTLILATTTKKPTTTTKKPTTTTKKPTTTTKKSLWTKNTKKHCFSSKHPTKYATQALAEAACLKLGSQCSGVYDNGCDNKDEFYTCTTAKWAASSSSCIYTPPKGWLVGAGLSEGCVV